MWSKHDLALQTTSGLLYIDYRSILIDPSAFVQDSMHFYLLGRLVICGEANHLSTTIC